jgi:hypothetical protein
MRKKTKPARKWTPAEEQGYQSLLADVMQRIKSFGQKSSESVTPQKPSRAVVRRRKPVWTKPSAELRLELAVGWIYASGYQETAGGFFGGRNFTRGFPDVPDFAFHLLRFYVLFDDCHSVPNGYNLCPFEFGAITVLNSQNKIFGKNSRHKIESDQKDFDRLFAHSAWVRFQSAKFCFHSQ